MSNDAKKTVDAIANKKLGDLGLKTVEGTEDLFADPSSSRRTMVLGTRKSISLQQLQR
jgi:hypothetical protein